MRDRLPWRRAALACGLAIPHVLACLPSDSPTPDADTDHDGLSDRAELEIYGTSPLMPDTDGDGYTDYQEVVTYAFDPNNDPDRFNPRIADLPMMTVYIDGPPLLTFVIQLADGSTVTVDNSISEAATAGVTYGPTWTQSQSDTQSVSQTTMSGSSVSPMTMNQTSVTTPLGSSTTSGGPSGSSPTDMFVVGAVPGDVDASIAGRDDDDDDDGGGDDDDGRAHHRREGGAPTPDASVAIGGTGEGSSGSSGGGSGGDNGAGSNGGSVTQTQGNSVTLTFDNSVSTTVNPSTTIQAQYSYTEQEMRQNTETLSRTNSLALSHLATVTGADLKVVTTIQNTGHVGFKVNNILLNSAFLDANGTLIPIGNMQLDQGLITTFQPFALSPGEETGPTNFSTIDLDLQAANAILASGRAITIRLAIYELDNADGKPFFGNVTDVNSKTALVAVDYGHGSTRRPELYQVATNFRPDRPGVSASELFQDILHIPYSASPQSGLTAVRDLRTVASGTSHWSVALVHDAGPDLITTTYGAPGDPYDFDTIVVHAGDVMHVEFVGAGGSAAYDGGVPPGTQLGAGPPAGGTFRVVSPPSDAGFP